MRPVIGGAAKEMSEIPQSEAHGEAAIERRRLDGWTVFAYVLAAAAPLVTAGLYLQATRAAGVETGFPLDDSWIHAQYARTLVEGRPFEYVPGERSIGTTSVLFDVVWAAATKLTGEYVYTIHTLNVLLTMGVGILVTALLLRFRLPPLTAGIGAALIVSSYPFPWSSLSGMETALATFLTTAAVLAHVTWGRRRGWRIVVGPVLMALAATARPENLVLFPLSEVDRVLMRWRQTDRDTVRRALLRFVARAAAFGLTMLPYFALNVSVHGALVPNTYAAKVGNFGLAADLEAEGIGALGLHLKMAKNTAVDAFWYVYAKDNGLLLALAGVGVFVLFLPGRLRGRAGDSFLPLLVFVGGTAAVGLITLGIFFPGQSQRYLIQWIPLILVYGVVGMHFVAGGVSRLIKPAPRLAYGLAVGAAALGSVGLLKGLYPDQVADYVTSVKNINEMQVALGRWVNENTPEDAVVATNDIGAIAFFGNRPIVDTIGLIDPEVVRRKNSDDPVAALIAYLESRGVTYALLFPRWHPNVILDRHFFPVHRVALEDNVICGDDQMVVMELDWDLKKAARPGPDWVDEVVAQCKMWRKVKKFLP